MTKFEIKKASNGEFYWVYVAANGEPICRSETYTTKQSAKHSIEVVQKNAASAEVVDLT
ncbi:MAG: YegP family protein [Brevefilum sp.]